MQGGAMTRETDTTGRYRLKDNGYDSFQWIVRGRDHVGRVIKNADGSFTGIIRGVQAQGNSWADVSIRSSPKSRASTCPNSGTTCSKSSRFGSAPRPFLLG
jgi:hypothetical protein